MNPVKMIAVPANRNPEKFLHVAKKVILRDRSGNEKRFNQFERTLRRGAFRAVSEMGSRRNDRHRLSMGWALVLAQLATQLGANGENASRASWPLDKEVTRSAASGLALVVTNSTLRRRQRTSYI